MKTIIKADSFQALSSISDQSVDLVITDPPYDFSTAHKLMIHRELERISRNGIIVFSPPENQWLAPGLFPDQFGFWIKPISTKNTSKSYSRFVEMIFFYKTKVWNTNRHWSQYTNVFMDLVDNSSLHPFRKPPSLIERLMLNHSNPGDLIFDPFSGSGVVAEVAKRNGRYWYGFEFEYEKYRHIYEEKSLI